MVAESTFVTDISTPETTVAPTPQPTHSSYYIPGLDTADLVRYFCEVVLDAEYVNAGNASVVQKWSVPILYFIHGTPTEEDLLCISSTVQWFNSIPGFPGMTCVDSSEDANLQIHFTDRQDMISLMGQQHAADDGAVTFWYENNQIYRGIICCRTDLDQHTRNSVIQEELYNAMGPIQDTNLRADSVIYSGFSTPQQLTEVDKLIMTLLYHPDMLCGMNATECDCLIRSLYP